MFATTTTVRLSAHRMHYIPPCCEPDDTMNVHLLLHDHPRKSETPLSDDRLFTVRDNGKLGRPLFLRETRLISKRLAREREPVREALGVGTRGHEGRLDSFDSFRFLRNQQDGNVS